MSSIFIARQPIIERRLRLYGYELLYRDGAGQAARIDDPDRATSDVLAHTLVDIGIDKITGDEGRIFINMTPNFITGELPLPDLKQRPVLEILESTLPESTAGTRDSGVRMVREKATDGFFNNLPGGLSDLVRICCQASACCVT